MRAVHLPHSALSHLKNKVFRDGQFDNRKFASFYSFDGEEKQAVQSTGRGLGLNLPAIMGGLQKLHLIGRQRESDGQGLQAGGVGWLMRQER